ncbi:hypothetical protein [Bryobacter aggregatus]|uniref:hypothetical protein n=1 Tax=Bryobacter aggregatus TaxID=360054 RepID=UPI0004E0B7D0|nr:hypothetical protein [Bryobacter aggregatus]
MGNAWVALQWLGLEYTDARHSIEWVYLTLARYIGVHGFATIYGDAEWFPYWYAGVPFENTYQPLLPYLVAISAVLAKISAGRAYHLVTGFFFCLGPLGVYLLARRLTRSIWPSLCAAAAYSLLSPCSWLMPSITADLHGYWSNQRLHVLSFYGEGPHLVSLALLPFALLALDWALEDFGWRRAALAALACALVPLSNLIGGFALGWGVLAVMAGRNWRGVPQALAIGAWAYLLSLRWLQPALLADIRRNAPLAGGHFVMDRWHYLALLGLILLSIGIAYKLRQRPALAIVAAFAFPMLVIPLSWEFGQYFFLPQPHRYHLEMDLALALLLAVVLGMLPYRNIIGGAGLAGLLVFGAIEGRQLDPSIRPLRLEETWEHRITNWMANQDPEARVYFGGSPRYFAGVEYDQPQFGGGFANGPRLPLHLLADYGIVVYKGDGKLTSAWLKAYGVDYVAVGDEQSANAYRIWYDPHQFDALLPVLWQEGSDRIFKLNRWNESLAHAIPGAALVVHPPTSYLDTAELFRYVNALEGPQSKGGDLRWLTPSRARIEASPGPEDAISIQIAYDPRWHASTNGQTLDLYEDGLGQMWLQTTKPGATQIDLEFRQSKFILLLCATAWMLWLGALNNFAIRRKPLS